MQELRFGAVSESVSAFIAAQSPALRLGCRVGAMLKY